MQVVSALGLVGDETVVDLGAGSGYFAFRVAKALPRGKVIAADIEPEMVRHIHHKAMTDGVQNIEATLDPSHRVGGSRSPCRTPPGPGAPFAHPAGPATDLR